MWVSVRGSEAAHRGGTLTVWGDRARFDTLDPALAYDWISYGVLQLTNDGLVGFRHTGGLEGTTLVPDLARTLPHATNGGRTYTFELRPGIRYSTGEVVQPEDFRRAVERVFGNLNRYGEPSAGVPYFSGIVGADDCTPGKPCDLSDGIVADDDTVTFNLSAPDPDFIYALTLPFAFAVPAETPDELGKHSFVPATGPYVVTTYTEGKEIVLDRNPRFSSWDEAARPDGFPDQIVWRLGTDPGQMAAKVLQGDADLMFTLPEPKSFAGLASQPRRPAPGCADTRDVVHESQHPCASLRRPQGPPSAELRGRPTESLQADRLRGAPGLPGRAAELPRVRALLPLHPAAWRDVDGSQPQGPPLVKESRTTGMKVTVWTAPSYFPPVAQYFRDLLKKLDYRATLKAVDDHLLFGAL